MVKEQKPKLLLMLDTETLGTTERSIMLSVAIKSFELSGFEDTTNESFEYQINISVASSLLYHRTSDYSTEEWWNAPERKAARLQMLADQTNANPLESLRYLYRALTELNECYDVYYFGRGVGSFDLPILSSNMRDVVGDSYVQPWKFWQVMDVRTLFRFSKWSGMEAEPIETPHSAMADVEKQIDEVQQAWNFFNKHSV